MRTASLPILYLLLVILWISAVPVLPGVQAAPASILLAPILYLAGGRIRGLLAGFAARDAAAPIALVLLGTFLIGGVLHILDPGFGALAGGMGIAGSLLLGLALSVGEPACAPHGSRWSASGSHPARLGRLLDGQALLALAAGAVAASSLGRFIDPRFESSGAGLEVLLSMRELATALAAGAGVGLAGWAAFRAFPADLPRCVLQIGLAEAAVVACAALGSEAAPLAALTAGFLARSGVERRAGPAGQGRPPGPDHHHPGGEEFPGASVVHAIAGAAIMILAASRLDLAQIGAAAPAGAALWLGSVVLRFLVQFGFGGLRRLGRPAEIPGRWLPALAWGSHPGPAALGLFLATTVERGTGPVVETIPPQCEATLLVAVLLALLFQGVTAGMAIAAAERGPSTEVARDRWMKLIARGIALRAERREVGELRSRGWLDDSAAKAMEDAICAAERQMEAEEEELVAGEPRLLAEGLTRAARRVLDAGRQAVAEARECGQVDEPAAREVERDLERLRTRAGSAPLADLLGAAPVEQPGGDRSPPGT